MLQWLLLWWCHLVSQVPFWTAHPQDTAGTGMGICSGITALSLRTLEWPRWQQGFVVAGGSKVTLLLSAVAIPKQHHPVALRAHSHLSGDVATSGWGICSPCPPPKGCHSLPSFLCTAEDKLPALHASSSTSFSFILKISSIFMGGRRTFKVGRWQPNQDEDSIAQSLSGSWISSGS